MPRKWKGVLAIEGVQTGDGRVIAEGALEWPDTALPLAWLKASMHGQGGEGGVSVGNIDAGSITRVDGGEIAATGILDDGHDDGAEVIRQLTDGTAPLGTRWGLSIDPDDWVVEMVDTAPQADEELVEIVASGRGPKALRAALDSFALVAAAGEPDPDGEVLDTQDVGRFVSRFTHLRIRGVTMVQTEAIVGAYLELDGDGVEPAADQEPEAVSAAASSRPPRAAFDMPEPEAGDPLLVDQRDGGWSVPLTITEADENGWRRVFGHLAHWEQCHIAYKDRCRGCPPSPSGYAHYRLHTVATDDGDVVTGPLVMGIDHASTDYRARLSLEAARDHYANSGLAWADVTIVDGQFGPWVAGVVKPDVDDATLARIRSNGWSGDWRPHNGELELVAIQSVPTPGFPQLRLVASGGNPIGTQVFYDEDGELSCLLIASAPAPVTASCGCGGTTAALEVAADTEVLGLLRTLERRTRHLIKAEAADLVASLGD